MKQRTLRGILTTTLGVIVALAVGSVALAFSSGPVPQEPIIPAVDAGDQSASGAAAATNCRTSYTNGSGPSELSWCYSDDGNVVMLEHGDGFEHVRIGAFVEGWCVAANGAQVARSGGSSDNFGLEAASYPHPTKVRHNTSDGSMRIESRFSTSPGNKQIVVKMNVRNLGTEVLDNVLLTRFIDADLANTTGLDEWTSTPRSVTAHEPGVASLTMFAKTDEVAALSLLYATANPNLDGNCYDADADATVSRPAGDRSMGVMYIL